MLPSIRLLRVANAVLVAALLAAAAGTALLCWCAAAARAVLPRTTMLAAAATGSAAIAAAVLLRTRGASGEAHAYLVQLPSTTRDVILLGMAVLAGAGLGWWTVRRATGA